ncbi:extracellular catalytic domain type 1 short-chain-length polyhydroxyalkanoate depolymerase [Frankia sp. AgKG'84/4]|uniref:extracellular catalytic domain type 1 short-chain-length polyhydroxyalkanoate depolymerase n=1 Tax=Frankia sp. AgKG'84/4 TaxID=573490 RepID=UPI00202A8C41|nr:PHB depolymerase family esterase [Frankia sp. AgKG'84/4]MCL9793261.1 polyhydroxybutyrate depolymerase [Frankia sp. AgKG'84/4]
MQPTASPGPSGRAVAHAGTTEHTLTVDGRVRTYLVHLPADSAPSPSALPVVVVLHGGGGSGAQVERQSGLSEVADRAGFLAVYPDGSGRLGTALLTWNAGTCCGYAHQTNSDDVAFVAAVLDQITRDHRIDPRRIYVTGMSNGAMMAYRLGCELAGRIAAIAPVSGALDTVTCTPSRPVSVIAFHGLADQRVPYGGGESSLAGLRQGDERADRSVAEAMTFWTRRDGCAATPARSTQGAVHHDVYGSCASGVAVELYSIEGAGHAWPGGTPPRGQADAPPPAPDASEVMWRFFAAHPSAG